MTPEPGNDAEVLFERRGALGLITLNRPKALNALTQGMCVAMKTQLDAWEKDDAVRAVAIRGSGDGTGSCRRQRDAFLCGDKIQVLRDNARGDPVKIEPLAPA